MQVLPLLTFYMKHGNQIEKLVDQGSTSDSHILIDIAQAVAPLLKQWYPQQAALIDDALAVLKEVTSPPPAAASTPDTA
jgi:hypothetical protein